MKDQLTENFTELNKAIKHYIQARIDLVKLLFLKKTSTFMSLLFGVLVSILFLTMIVTFTGAAFTIWYGQTFGNYLTGALIVLGALLAVFIIFIVFRKKFLTSFFISKASQILFEEDEEELEDDL